MGRPRQRWFDTVKRDLSKINNTWQRIGISGEALWKQQRTLMARINRPEEEEKNTLVQMLKNK